MTLYTEFSHCAPILQEVTPNFLIFRDLSLLLYSSLRGGQTILSISYLQSQCKVLASLFRLILPILLILSVILQQNYLVYVISSNFQFYTKLHDLILQSHFAHSAHSAHSVCKYTKKSSDSDSFCLFFVQNKSLLTKTRSNWNLIFYYFNQKKRA